MKTVKITLLSLTLGLMSFTIHPIQREKYFENRIANPITWKNDTIEVGDIPQGIPKLIEFEFKNTGISVVKITDVHGSCGCTTTDYTKEEIAPGKTGIIKATFNAINVGGFTKTVTVKTTAEENTKVLVFKGKVLAKS